MLGEAAVTAAQAERYMQAYRRAIHAIGRAARRRGIYEGPGISIKLSALHPRYSRAQSERVQAELYPRLKELAVLARHYDIGLNIDAEEADRLELSLDLLERLCFEPELAGWNGVGFVVQAYQKRARFTIDWLIDLARRSRRRLMVRLVKGAYWDSEIKRAQVDGLEDFPVFTRRIHTDVSYLACARKLLAAPDAAFPQFATHNALTLATIHAMAGENFYAGQYEFQCLHGMGEPLYEEVVGPDEAQPAVPHLCAGRHARDPARLSGAPPAGERRQHLVRQPDRRSRRHARHAVGRPGRARQRPASRSARRIRRSPCRATCSARRGRIRAASISPTSRCWRRWRRSCRQAASWRPCLCWPTDRARAAPAR